MRGLVAPRSILLVVLLAPCTVAGCAASGSDGEVHGPVFGASDGGDAAGASDSMVVVGADASADSSPVVDSTVLAGDAGLDATGDAPLDASSGGDASDAGTCSSTIAILGGSASSLFGATAIGAGAFTLQTLSGSATTTPALAAFNAGFQALLTESGDAGGGNPIFATALAGATWSTPVALGGNASAIDGPGIAAVGATLQAVYLNPQHFYFHAAFGGTWDTGADPVRPPADAGVQAFGPVGAAAAGTATQLVIAYEGNDLHPYAQTWTSGVGWDNGVALGAALVAANTGSAIARLDGGANDLLVVYVDGEGAGSPNNTHLFAVLRSASTKAWSTPAMVNVNAYTKHAPTLTAMSGGRALLAWEGDSPAAGYASVYTAGATPAWSAPVQLTSATLARAPSVAAGVCGDDAVAAYVSGGAVYTARFAGGAWKAPLAVGGVTGAAVVAVATSP